MIPIQRTAAGGDLVRAASLILAMDQFRLLDRVGRATDEDVYRVRVADAVWTGAPIPRRRGNLTPGGSMPQVTGGTANTAGDTGSTK